MGSVTINSLLLFHFFFKFEFVLFVVDIVLKISICLDNSNVKHTTANNVKDFHAAT